MPYDSLLNEIEIKVKFRITEKEENLTDRFYVKFVIVDSAGIPDSFFSPADIPQNKVKQFKQRLKRGMGIQYLRFTVKTKDRLQAFDNRHLKFMILTQR